MNAINPGVVSSDIFYASGMCETEEEKEKALKDIAGGVPLGRVGEPQDVASLALFLADNKAAGW